MSQPFLPFFAGVFFCFCFFHDTFRRRKSLMPNTKITFIFFFYCFFRSVTGIRGCLWSPPTPHPPSRKRTWETRSGTRVKKYLYCAQVIGISVILLMGGGWGGFCRVMVFFFSCAFKLSCLSSLFFFFLFFLSF
ncbi:hypothetical protein EDD21DRAFT_393929 [Dissophora ornata]|nr:hypothetical protein EDD21DRAFT_393929 [Dissophora ornata]